MADLTKIGKNNQKREVVVAVSETTATSATMDDTLFNIPVIGVLIKSVTVVVETVSGAATSTVDVKMGATVIANETAVTATGAVTTAVDQYFATGGSISIVAGAVAPDAAGRLRVMVEYIELDTTNGNYIG